MRSGATMKVSLTPDRLKTFEVRPFDLLCLLLYVDPERLPRCLRRKRASEAVDQILSPAQLLPSLLANIKSPCHPFPSLQQPQGHRISRGWVIKPPAQRSSLALPQSTPSRKTRTKRTLHRCPVPSPNRGPALKASPSSSWRRRHGRTATHPSSRRQLPPTHPGPPSAEHALRQPALPRPHQPRPFRYPTRRALSGRCRQLIWDRHQDRRRHRVHSPPRNWPTQRSCASQPRTLRTLI